MIRVLVVDDSALMRRLLAEILSADEGFELDFARGGGEALAMMPTVRPDVVTLDINMPQMDGLTCLNQIMLLHPCPVLMFSSQTAAGAQATLEALELGAVDFLAKPSGAVSLTMETVAEALIEKVRTAAKAKVAKSHRLVERIRLRSGLEPRPARASRTAARPIGCARPSASLSLAPDAERLVIIGCSTGGPPALDAVLQPLPADFPFPIVVAQHMPASFTGALAARLDRMCAISVTEVERMVVLEPAKVYIAKGGADLIISRRGERLVAMPAPSAPQYRWHPSVDRLVESAMTVVEPDRLTGILMTGMGDDGAAAMTRLRGLGGRTVAEAEETAVVWGMPGELVRMGGADYVERVDAIAGRLLSIAGA